MIDPFFTSQLLYACEDFGSPRGAFLKIGALQEHSGAFIPCPQS